MPEIESETEEGLHATTLGDAAVARLRDAIVFGAFAPAERLAETELATRFSISRTGIREAFAILEAEGLIRRSRNRFTQVAAFSPRDARDVLQMRAAIEGLCAGIIAETNGTPTQTLTRRIERIADAIRATPTDFRAYVEHDLAFHRAVVEASRNRHALRHFQLLETQLKTMLFLVQTDIPITDDSTITLHESLIETLQNATPQEARDVFERHALGILPWLETRLQATTNP